MRLALALAVAAIVACGTGPPQVALPSPSPAPSVTLEPESTATPLPSPSPSPSPSPTPVPGPRTIRTIAGLEFAMVAGVADLRIDPAISRDDEAALVATVAGDVEVVEADFGLRFGSRPVIYVFAANESYATGLERIFGYSAATAAFVAENSVSFFEPSLLTIAINWQAVGARRPVSAIRHELTHRLTLDACAPRCDLVPAWLNEGEARLAEARVAGGEWRYLRVRYEAASMAMTGTLIPLNTLVSQLSWNALTDWAGYYKYQEAARATELLRADIGGADPIARLYQRIRRGETVAQAYAVLTGRSFDDFVASLETRMRGDLPAPPGIVTIGVAPEGPGASYLLYGFPPNATVAVTITSPRSTETWPLVISPFGASFDGIGPGRASGRYTISIQHPGGVLTVKVAKTTAGAAGDER